jgi:hypothetical protein
MQAVSADAARIRTENKPHGIGLVRFHDYFGQFQQLQAGPQAYLVEHLDPQARIYPHFHDVDQFQVFVRGKGRVGKQPVPPITVQYADGYSPYGPIVADGVGLAYFTLRLAPASGGWRMPGNRRLMPGRAGRTFSIRFDNYATIPQRREDVLRSSLWGPAGDGLEVVGLRVGPGAEATSDEPGGGQYIVICSGYLTHGGRTLPINSLLFLGPDELRASFKAGPDGAVLLLLKYPRPTDRPGSNPEQRRTHDAYVLAGGDA